MVSHLERLGFSPQVGGLQTHAPAIAAADRAIRPVSVALGAFGALAALSLLIVVVQVIGRQLRRHADESATVRALGAGPGMTMADAVAGIIGAGLVGSFVAVGVAVALSPLFPLGPVRPVYPLGIAVDVPVLALGLVAMVIMFSGVAVLEAYQLDLRLRGRVGRVAAPTFGGDALRHVVGHVRLRSHRGPLRRRPGGS